MNFCKTTKFRALILSLLILITFVMPLYSNEYSDAVEKRTEVFIHPEGEKFFQLMIDTAGMFISAPFGLPLEFVDALDDSGLHVGAIAAFGGAKVGEFFYNSFMIAPMYLKRALLF